MPIDELQYKSDSDHLGLVQTPKVKGHGPQTRPTLFRYQPKVESQVTHISDQLATNSCLGVVRKGEWSDGRWVGGVDKRMGSHNPLSDLEIP